MQFSAGATSATGVWGVSASLSLVTNQIDVEFNAEGGPGLNVYIAPSYLSFVQNNDAGSNVTPGTTNSRGQVLVYHADGGTYLIGYGNHTPTSLSYTATLSVPAVLPLVESVSYQSSLGVAGDGDTPTAPEIDNGIENLSSSLTWKLTVASTHA